MRDHCLLAIAKIIAIPIKDAGEDELIALDQGASWVIDIGFGGSNLSIDSQEGQKLFGSPAIDVNQYLRSYAVFKNLPDLSSRLKQLEEKVLNLPTN